MSDRNRFFTPGSPLEGKRLPPDWHVLTDLNVKRRALVSMGYAQDFESAKRLLGQHSAAVRRYRRSVVEARAKSGGKFSL
jgi:hypothetical protein